jgi:hypothetical protein
MPNRLDGTTKRHESARFSGYVPRYDGGKHMAEIEPVNSNEPIPNVSRGFSREFGIEFLECPFLVPIDQSRVLRALRRRAIRPRNPVEIMPNA